MLWVALDPVQRHYVGMDELPEDIDPALWIRCSRTGGQDYLVEGNPHTFPGRMSAFCPHVAEYPYYNVSIGEVEECSPESRLWMRGFVAGSEPDVPLDSEGCELDDADPKVQGWAEARSGYMETGYWPPEAPRRL